MKNTTNKRFARKILAASIAAIGLTQFAAQAAEVSDEVARLTLPESEIELGAIGVSDDSFKFGEYTGLEEEQTYAIANVRLLRRDAEDGRYLEIIGRDLGLDSRSLSVEGGQQGNFGITLQYDQLPRLISDSYETPFTNPGSTNLNLPAGFVRASNTAGMTTLDASMRPFDVQTERKSLGIGLTKQLSDQWAFSLSFKNERKEGERFMGGVVGNSGGNPKAVIIPEPVDYTTKQFDAALGYTSDKLQLQLAYYGSLFENSNNRLRWDNPFTNAAWGCGASTCQDAQISLAPDNQFHQIALSGGYSFSDATRLTGSLSYGRMTQDDHFLPYSINPALLVATPMPRNSLDGEVDVVHVDFKLTSSLMDDLNLTAAYRYNDRENETPQAEYVYIGGDSMQQPVANATDKTRTNLPRSVTTHEVDVDLDYQLSDRTKLDVGYVFEYSHKDYEAITGEHENTFKAGVDHQFSEKASAGLNYAYSDRDTSDYDATAPFLASYTGEAYIAGLPADQRWDNLPAQKKFFLAPRHRNKMRAFVNLYPTERLDLQLGADMTRDSYHESEFGLRDAKGWALNFDANMMFTDVVSGHAFASLENYGTDQRSQSITNKTTHVTDPTRDFSVDIDDRTFTLGLGFRAKPLSGKYEFGGDFTHAYTNGAIRVNAGSAFNATPALPMPDLITRLNRVDLFGRYWIKKDWALNVNYIYEHYESKDWAVDGTTATTLGNVIGTNQDSPDYRVHALGVSVSYSFR